MAWQECKSDIYKVSNGQHAIFQKRFATFSSLAKLIITKYRNIETTGTNILPKSNGPKVY